VRSLGTSSTHQRCWRAMNATLTKQFEGFAECCLELECTLLGDLIDETCTRYVYRRRFGDTLALVDKRPPTIHVVPCKTCPDYPLIISGLAQVQACGEA